MLFVGKTLAHQREEDIMTNLYAAIVLVNIYSIRKMTDTQGFFQGGGEVFAPFGNHGLLLN